MENLVSKVKRLTDLADYQTGSIVSRTIIDKEAGTVTFFHTAPFDAMLNILDGEAEIVISGKTFNLKAGEIIIMPANKPHAVKAVKKFKMILIMIKS